MLLYYFPGASNVKDVAPFGLGHLRGCWHTYRECAGPDGGRGIVASYTPKGAQRINPVAVKYDATGQTWANCGLFWLGYDTRPKPEDLERPNLKRGLIIPLGDGQSWVVPCTQWLPSAAVFEDGRWTRRRVEQYNQQYADAETVFTWILNRDAVPFEQLCEIATRALAINYHIGPHELSALGVLTEECIEMLLYAMLDMAQRDEISKAWAEKNELKQPEVVASDVDTHDISGIESGETV